MPFQPQALDERTLKAFVDRLMQSLRQSSSTPPKRSAAQETVARMLGFPHWHAAITAIGAPRTQPAAVPPSAGRPSVGLYPAEPMVFTPDHAEALLRWAFSVGAHQVTVVTGERLFIQVSNRIQRATHRVMTAQDEEAFAVALKSPHSLEWLKSQDSEWATTLKSPSQDHLRVRANRVSITQATTQGIQLHMKLLSTRPPDLVEAVNNPQLEHHLTSSPGLVLVTGGTSSGKTTLMGALKKSFQQQPGQRIISLESPITFNYTDLPVATGTTLVQHEVGDSHQTVNDRIAQAMRMQPSSLFVDQCRDPSTLETCIAASATGARVFLNLHSDNVPMALTRALGRPDWKKSASELVDSLGMVVSQRLLPQDNGTFLALHEWLVFTPEVKQDCLTILAEAKSPYHFRALLEHLLDQHGHTFEDHGQGLFAQGLLSEKTLRDLTRYQTLRRKWKDEKVWE